VSGWLIEVFFRSLSNMRLINPGFLSGPYLPIYGFGTIILYYISSLNISFLPKVALFGLSTTILELFTGLFFYYFYSIRLWDYSRNLFNYKGIICPLYSFFWIVFSVIFYLFAYSGINHLLEYFKTSLYILFSVGFFYGIMFSDIFNSFNIAFRIKSYAKEFDKNMHLRVNYIRLKIDVRARLNKFKEASSFETFFFSLNNTFHNELYEQLRKNFQKISKHVVAPRKRR
jgi:uncharacterized membrane protein